jgi:hypothetical protein
MVLKEVEIDNQSQKSQSICTNVTRPESMPYKTSQPEIVGECLHPSIYSMDGAEIGIKYRKKRRFGHGFLSLTIGSLAEMNRERAFGMGRQARSSATKT